MRVNPGYTLGNVCLSLRIASILSLYLLRVRWVIDAELIRYLLQFLH